MEGGGGDLLSDHGGLVEILNNYSLPMRPININEYGTAPEQVCTVLFPTALAWYCCRAKSEPNPYQHSPQSLPDSRTGTVSN